MIQAHETLKMTPMTGRMHKIRLRFNELSIVDKAFLIALIVEALYVVLGQAGLPQPGFGIARFAFIIIAIIFVIRAGPRLTRKLLWRVRRRLIVTWILVGVVPIALVCVLLAEGLYILMGQVVGYMTANEILRQSEAVHSSAYALAWNVGHRPQSTSASELAQTFLQETAQTSSAQHGAIVRTRAGAVAIAGDGAIRDIPEWVKPGFVGLVKEKDDLYFAADVALTGSEEQGEVFLYQNVPAALFKNLLADVATIVPVEGSAKASGIEIRRTQKSDRHITFNVGQRPSDDPEIEAPLPPPGRGGWDFAVRWFVLLPYKNLQTGAVDNTIAIFATRPSLIVKKLFTTVGPASFAVALALLITTAIALLVVETISVLFGAKLTRSMTRSVADIYEGTQKVQEGDLSHRIPVRKTKDQLSDLAGSFNTMTERVQKLIVEAKEKERLENELAIARDVQSRLFPKETPKFEGLELWGGCQPARTVSGDYYDFISLTPSHMAFAISDISGKGISAALLMAHIQSALRSQLTGGNGRTSPSGILSILNDHLYASSPPEKYATLFLGIYAAGELIYTNAGHLAPMLVRDGRVVRLAGSGFPVGLFPGIAYEQNSASLRSGDLLVAFTDGVTETPNDRGEEFGDDRLSELLLRHFERPLDEIAGVVSASVEAWAGGLERHDDTTLLLARCC